MSLLKQPGRRYFLGVLGGTALLGTLPGMAQSGQYSAEASGHFTPDLELELRAVPDLMSLFPGTPTDVLRYRAKVLKGDARAVSHHSESPLGSVIRVQRGTRVRIHFINELTQPILPLAPPRLVVRLMKAKSLEQ